MPALPSAPPEKPYLAIVAPYPPARSGVADYVAQQVAGLAQHYQLVLVQTDPAQIKAVRDFPGQVLDADAFLQAPHLHQRVLYHIGNSPAHLEAIKLLAAVPGIVILHDFFLSDVQQYQDIILNGHTHATYTALIHSHGFAPLMRAVEQHQTFNLSDYPCNLGLLEQARQVRVHSDYVLRQAAHWYGDPMDHRIGRIGFAKALPKQLPDRVATRQAQGFAPDDYLVATFGFATPAKALETLIHAWATSALASDPRAHLLIVGEFLDPRYKKRIERLLELRPCANIQCLGYVDPADYQQLMSATDLAVQLRIHSRGETSAALLDCMANGVPVIANQHGFVEDLPDDVLWKIGTQPQAAELSAVLELLHEAPEVRQRIAGAAKDHLRQSFEPAHVVSQLVNTIEAATAQASATSPQPAAYNHRLLIDITAVARFDLRTGIQRVVRSLLREFILDEPDGYRVLPIYLDHDGTYRYAHQFMLQTLSLPLAHLEDAVVTVNAGDIYLGVDLHTTTTVRSAAVYNAWRQQGVRVINVLYDLLPVRSPQWFPAMVEPDFTAWARHIALNSDGVLAISRTVAEDFAQWLQEQGIDQQRQTPLDIGWFHLGSDLAASVPSTGMPDDAAEVLQHIASAPSFLMVGTIEPRKGHAQTLAAFEQLWTAGHDCNLVIIGKEGWHVEEVADTLRQHPRLGRQLFWLEGISDEYLEQIYPRCVALVAASEGEGFGLPLIEAARHHIPVIARDIPVFREVGGEGAYYFKADKPDQLAQALAAWMQRAPADRPDPNDIRCLNWRESAAQVKDFITNPSSARQRVS